MIVNTRYITLDASQSYSAAGNTPLTFLWTARNNDGVISNPTSATPNVTLPFNIVPGSYVFDLTVTDSKGNTSSAPLTVTYVIVQVP